MQRALEIFCRAGEGQVTEEKALTKYRMVLAASCGRLGTMAPQPPSLNTVLLSSDLVPIYKLYVCIFLYRRFTRTSFTLESAQRIIV